eukprot:3413902-Pleurochrysis_carterae.AAC.5
MTPLQATLQSRQVRQSLHLRPPHLTVIRRLCQRRIRATRRLMWTTSRMLRPRRALMRRAPKSKCALRAEQVPGGLEAWSGGWRRMVSGSLGLTWDFQHFAEAEFASCLRAGVVMKSDQQKRGLWRM